MAEKEPRLHERTLQKTSDGDMVSVDQEVMTQLAGRFAQLTSALAEHRCLSHTMLFDFTLLPALLVLFTALFLRDQ